MSRRHSAPRRVARLQRRVSSRLEAQACASTSAMTLSTPHFRHPRRYARARTGNSTRSIERQLARGLNACSSSRPCFFPHVGSHRAPRRAFEASRFAHCGIDARERARGHRARWTVVRSRRRGAQRGRRRARVDTDARGVLFVTRRRTRRGVSDRARADDTDG